jgi:hypothetical protein
MEDLKIGGFKYVCNLLKPKEGVLVSDVCRKGSIFMLVELGLFGKEKLTKFTSKKALLQYVREKYSFAHAKKAECMIKGVRSQRPTAKAGS